MIAQEPLHAFDLHPRGPFSLAESRRFLHGFGPISSIETDDHLHLGFVADGGEEAAGVCIRQEDAVVHVESFGGTDAEIVEAQVARILSLDVDATGFEEVGERDPVIGRLQSRYPGLRPVLFPSPYEAAVWAILSSRVQMAQAARVKGRMAEELGQRVSVHGEEIDVFPAPERLLTLESFPGLFGRKVEYLQGIAHATLNGDLDAAMLRSLPVEEALSRLRKLPGIGPFGSGLILLRGAGTPDGTPGAEPRLLAALERAYGLDHRPNEEELLRMAEAWRPYRTWVTFLLRRSGGDLGE